MPTLIERIEKLRQIKALHEYFIPVNKNEVVEVSRMLGKPILKPNCENCLIEAILYLKKINLELMAKTTAKIKDGQFIMVPFTSDSYTNENLTDAIARKLLKEYPALAESFKKLPPDEPVEGDEDYTDPNAPKVSEDEEAPTAEDLEQVKKENEELKKQIEALKAAQQPTAQPEVKPLPESTNAPKTPAQKDNTPVKDAK